MFVAHAFYADGTLAHTRGGFTTQAAAEQNARSEAARRRRGAWSVVKSLPHRWHNWAVGDHSQPVEGATVAQGGFELAR
jgi:hypothetical protein